MIGGERIDYAFPFRIDAVSQRAAQAPYAAHVEQMIEQILLTTPGERSDLPSFGCGLRRLVFAPVDQSLSAALQLQVMQSLAQWLEGVIQVAGVTVATSDDNAALDPGTVQVTVSYTLVETQTSERATVTL